MRSCIYRGDVGHRRRLPRPHEFRTRLYMMYLDLDELDEVFRGRWLWSVERRNVASFRRADYLGDPEVPLRDAVLDRVHEELGRRPRGSVRLLTQLRCFGYAFNPVSFYFCFAEDGTTLDAIVAEITNTPWKERHSYVLDARDRSRFEFRKTFHVSPFMPMEQTYRWHFGTPGERLAVHMENHESGESCFDATLTMHREEIGAGSLARALLRHPFMTAKVVATIYFQALRLKLKKIPFHPHPNTASDAAGETR